MTPEDKTCVSCGRRITWRRKWERTWDEVRHCSDACRRRGVGPLDRELEEVLRRLVGVAGRAGVDPDEAAARVAAGDPATLHEPARRAARRLVAGGEAQMVQRGRVVDPSTARGPVRLRRG